MNNLLKTIEKHKPELEKRSYKKGETLFYENELCTKIGFVNEGEVAIKSYLSNGKEIVYNVIKKGQMFGNNLLFSSNPHYRGDVVVEQNSVIFFINKDKIINLLQKDKELLESYLNEQSDFSKTLNLKIKLLTITSAADRFLYFMSVNKGEINYKSVTKLANDLFLTRESLSRTIQKLVKNGLIKRVGKNIRLVV